MSNSNLRWNLEKILEDRSFEDLLDDYFIKIRELVKLYEDDIFSHKEKLLKFHTVGLQSTIISNRVFNYLSCKCNEDLNNLEWRNQYINLKKDSIPFHQKLSDFNEKSLQNRDLILEHLQDERLHPWKLFYSDIFRRDKHQVPSIVKKFLTSYSQLNDSYEQIFISLLETGLTIKPAKDSKRKLHQIKNYEDFINTQYDRDRVLRKNAYCNWFTAVTSVQETFAKLLYYATLKQNIGVKNCNFENFYEYQIFEDEIDHAFIPYVYRKVSRFHAEYKKFKKIRQNTLKKTYSLRSIKPWDKRLPITKDVFDQISISEAQKLAIESLSIFGNKYVENVKKAFDERWIDWEPREGKISGAYCIGGNYGLESKYILINYSNTMRDVFTLVHELGHAIHSVEYCEHQNIYANSTIFIAEIPSSLNEIILSFYLLEKYKDSPMQKITIYDNLLTNFFDSTINQVILSDVEYELNKSVSAGRVINASELKLMYKAKQEKYQGNRITKPLSKWKDLALSGILTIPHFYSEEFYVYKYAVGQIVALLIAIEIYKNKNQEMINRFFEFLRAGCSKSNLELLKVLNIDLEKTYPWSKVKEEVKKWINEYMELSKKI